MTSKITIKRNLHLILSILVVVPVACVYGFQPNILFNVTINSIDEATIFKAIMGLYLGFSILWMIGILKPAFWKAATVSNLIFMLGLAFGRIISMFFDGMPSTIFVLGTIGELTLGFYACYQLKQERASIEAL
jgi:hypothetical protein